MRSIDFTGKKEYNYVYEDGVIVRSTECDITVNGETVGARTPVNTVLYNYNGGTLVKKRIIPENGFDTEQVYTYPKNNGNTASCTFVRGDTTVTATSVTDGLGRAVSESIATGSGTISRNFTYTKGDSSPVNPPLNTDEYKPTTQLVSKIELSDGTVLDYVYDACGRIKTVTETRNGTSTVTEYTYDSLGQLLTETVNGTAVNCMSYDSYGNITEKNGVSYSYDSTWKDRLKFVGNNEIEYGTDPCNPEKYFGNSLVWEKGRQLKKFGENISYKYNANGIRTRKTVNDRNHFYFLDGTKILRETWGTDTLVPIYDANESVIGLTRSTESGTNTYYFLKNLQGDIIALTDKAGAVVARYKYDAWGKVLSVTDANGNAITSPYEIANINPFRYRGYYYDTETGLYYLQSRYYDPAVGRFINADDPEIIDIASDYNVIAQNKYSYCLNSPTNNSDGYGALAGSITRMICNFFFGLAGGILGMYLGNVALNVFRGEKNIYAKNDSWGQYVAEGVKSGAYAIFGNKLVLKIFAVVGASIIKHIVDVLISKKVFSLWGMVEDIIIGILIVIAIHFSTTLLKKIPKKNQTSKLKEKINALIEKIGRYISKKIKATLELLFDFLKTFVKRFSISYAKKCAPELLKIFK